MTTEDIAAAVAKVLRPMGMPIYVKGHFPDGLPVEDGGRITVIPKSDGGGGMFRKCYVEVNASLPDLHGECNPGLDGVERELRGLVLTDTVDTDGAEWYRLSLDHIGTERDKALECHYIHIQLLFETLNA